MAMPKNIHDKLKELLKDAKEGDKSLLDTIAEWQDAAEAKEKVQKANDEIIKERETLKTEIKELKKSVSGKEDEVKRLQENMLTEDDKKKFDEFKKKGMTLDVETKFNKLESTLETVTKTLTEEKKRREDSEKKAADSYMTSVKAKLTQELTNALTAKKIEGDNVDVALSIIDRKGLVKLEPKEDGAVERKLYVYDDKGKVLAAETVEDIASYIATKHQNLVSASGRSGTGLDHASNPPPTNTPNMRTLSEVQAHAAGMIERTFK